MEDTQKNILSNKTTKHKTTAAIIILGCCLISTVYNNGLPPVLFSSSLLLNNNNNNNNNNLLHPPARSLQQFDEAPKEEGIDSMEEELLKSISSSSHRAARRGLVRHKNHGHEQNYPNLPNLRDPKSIELKSDVVSSSSWKCCISPIDANPTFISTPSQDDIGREKWRCRTRPSNFGYYYGNDAASSTSINNNRHHHDNGPANTTAVGSGTPLPPPLDASKWTKKNIYFVGGSTTRQMIEQIQWEFAPSLVGHHDGKLLPSTENTDHYDYADRFIFLHHQPGRCCDFNGDMTLDTRALSPGLDAALSANYDYIVINVGTWWGVNAIGYVIDEIGNQWHLKPRMSPYLEWGSREAGNEADMEWELEPSYHYDQTTAIDVSFSAMMRRALMMIMKKKKPTTTVIWRSETKTDCQPTIGSNFRSTITPVLTELSIPVLNISKATCQYADLALDDSIEKGPHLCFPSVALRYWLQEFQRLFL